MTQTTTPKLLIVAYGAANNAGSYSHRIKEIASVLAGTGARVLVLWLSPAYRLWPQHQFAELRQVARVVVWPTLPLHAVRGVGFFARLGCQLAVRLVARWFQPDVVHAETTLCAGLVIRTGLRQPLVVDVHGDVPAEMQMAGRPDWTVRQTERDTALALRHADLLITASLNLQAHLLSSGKTTRLRTACVPCSVNVERFTSVSGEREAVRARHGMAGRRVVCYAGGLAVWQCIGETLDLFRALRQRDQRVFSLILTADDLGPWTEQLRQLGVPGEDYLVKSLRPSEVPQWLCTADAGLLLRAAHPVNAAASPTKLGEYLAAGVPVVTTRHAGDAPGIIAGTSCGLVLNEPAATGPDLDRLQVYLDDIMSTRPVIAATCQDLARQHHSWEAAASRLTEAYRLCFETAFVSPALPENRPHANCVSQ